jgi:hypothetical protein
MKPLAQPCAHCGKPVEPHRMARYPRALSFCTPGCLLLWLIGKDDKAIRSLSPRPSCPWCKIPLRRWHHDTSCPVLMGHFPGTTVPKRSGQDRTFTWPCSFCGKAVYPHPKIEDSGYVLAFCKPECLARWQIDKSEVDIDALSPNMLRCPWCKSRLASGHHEKNCPVEEPLEALCAAAVAKFCTWSRPTCSNCQFHVLDALYADDPEALRRWGDCSQVLTLPRPLPAFRRQRNELPDVTDRGVAAPYIENDCCESGARLRTPIGYSCPLHRYVTPAKGSP